MQKNFTRILVGSLLGVAVLTITYFLIKHTALVNAAYIWSIFALAAFAISLGFWATGSQIKYILHAAFPMLLQGYLATTLIIAAAAVILQLCRIVSIPWGWFCLIEFIVLAFFAWKVLALDAGREAIVDTEQMIKAQTVNWKLVVVDLAAIVNRAGGDDQAVIRQAADAARYADPMEHPGVSSEVCAIKDCVNALSAAVNEGKSAEIPAICANIERLIKERASKLLILK